jgi:putative 4-mercaptohistidine N1-methyltranferase
MSAIYEDPGVLAEYLLFHYGTGGEILPPETAWPEGMSRALDFAVRTTLHFSGQAAGRGLDLGCAVGRSTYEMSRSCGHVTGVDFSHAFIGAANRLREGESVAYVRRDEGHLATALRAELPPGIDPSKVDFMQGDAMALPGGMGGFDRVHAANLICRLTDPVRLLDRFPDLVNPGGELVLATPCTWLEGFTAPENWPPGDTLEWLQGHLGGAFDLVKCTDEPFLIRETARKFQWTRSMLTVWRRR